MPVTPVATLTFIHLLNLNDIFLDKYDYVTQVG